MNEEDKKAAFHILDSLNDRIKPVPKYISLWDRKTGEEVIVISFQGKFKDGVYDDHEMLTVKNITSNGSGTYKYYSFKNDIDKFSFEKIELINTDMLI